MTIRYLDCTNIARKKRKAWRYQVMVSEEHTVQNQLWMLFTKPRKRRTSELEGKASKGILYVRSQGPKRLRNLFKIPNLWFAV